MSNLWKTFLGFILGIISLPIAIPLTALSLLFVLIILVLGFALILAGAIVFLIIYLIEKVF